MLVVSILQATGFQFLLLLSAPWWMTLSKRLLQASSWDGIVPAPWSVELVLVLLLGRAEPRGMFTGLWAQEDFMQSVLLMVDAVFLPCWLFGLRCPSTGAHRLLGGARSW